MKQNNPDEITGTKDDIIEHFINEYERTHKMDDKTEALLDELIYFQINDNVRCIYDPCLQEWYVEEI